MKLLAIALFAAAGLVAHDLADAQGRPGGGKIQLP